MNADTKRHIDSARQVLVGVVPNPTSQIEQITNALIYKFMDDMDQAAVKVGGEPSFFVGNLEKYSWTRIMDARLGNQERMNLYTEALAKFSEAKQLPELFRGIFKSAFLPYRNPATLDLFLKEIDYFDYSHPEELGNAYEYLLSIMSSQGDAGQFRTPRHIIDFMVEVVNPTKDDKILDPACGTGGFLVSAYRHILEKHEGKSASKGKEKTLTPDQKKKLAGNFEGYDIDPTMVRIAQVNMYLHQFKNPKIYQYDSLSSEERWNDKFDVILANPPFMSPKGGIKPHSKFSIQSSRSEVLFVDYILNHLRPNGRAGIIVPEGVIFQTGTAFKELRKNLVNDGLVAVVSLPSGVFQPYSGVKTSVLFFDNELSKSKNEILFVKVENDGFDLGAQRRPISRNDLPLALSILKGWRDGRKDQAVLATYVEKAKIVENGDYNLSGDRYREAVDYSNVQWPVHKFGQLEKAGEIEFLRGQGLSKKDISKEGRFKCVHYGEIYTAYESVVIKNVVSATDVDGKVRSEEGDVLVPATTTADAMGISVARSINVRGVVVGGDINIIRTKNKSVLADYLAYLISYPPLKVELSKYAKGANILHISNNDIRRLSVVMPPLEVQGKIVDELDGYSAIITGAKQIVANWRPKIDIDPNWKKVKLSRLCMMRSGGTPPKSERKYWKGDIPWASSKDIKTDFIYDTEDHVSELAVKETTTRCVAADILLAVVRSGILKHTFPVALTMRPMCHNQDIVSFEVDRDKLDARYLFYTFKSDKDIIRDGIKPGVTVQSFYSGYFSNYEIALPSLKIQHQVVEKIEEERSSIESAKKMISVYEGKIAAVIAELWK